ncbi:hypothetical protein [Budvicia aquatica]|uniref:Uncharacterized protein n=1 Tax=Budvicia aquatica TaxID=82979 RepID=A0A2C6C1G9_9GAMM|nr:hypothetical protein [Budvicia aquatica]PHI30190.1 hypothetical protein CRN84_13000 [Budvicia aquatica]GKX53294.1 hypothetical protein SOASR029_36030 [Budvicia aquatica]VFS49231.1 Uncharacterised protein [Budvicia aquatica]
MKIKPFDLSVIVVIIVATVATCLLAFELLKNPTHEQSKCYSEHASNQINSTNSQKNAQSYMSYIINKIENDGCKKSG